MAFDSFITPDGENLLNHVNQIANLTVRSQYRAGTTNWGEINPLTYSGAMPTDYETIMNSSGANAPIVSFDENRGSVTSQLVNNGFGLEGCRIDTSFVQTHQAEMAAKAGDTEKKNGTGSYTYEINDKGEITYKKPDGSKCTVTEFRTEAGNAEFKKAQEEAKAKKEKG